MSESAFDHGGSGGGGAYFLIDRDGDETDQKAFQGTAEKSRGAERTSGGKRFRAVPDQGVRTRVGDGAGIRSEKRCSLQGVHKGADLFGISDAPYECGEQSIVCGGIGVERYAVRERENR